MFKMKRAQAKEPRHDEGAEIRGSNSETQESAARSGPAGPGAAALESPGAAALKSPGAAALKSKVRPTLTQKRRSTPPPDGATIRQQFEAVRRYAAEPSAGFDPHSRPSVAEEPSRLLIGREISFKGRIGDCETLIVEGKVAADAKCRALQVHEAGVYEGEIAVETAEIFGRVEGRIRVRGRLTIRAAGQVAGDITYGELDIDAGGRLTGNIRHGPVHDETTKDKTTKDEPTKDETTKGETTKDRAAVVREPAPPAQPVVAKTAEKAAPNDPPAPPAPPDPSDVGAEARPRVAAAASTTRGVAAKRTAAASPNRESVPVAVGTAGERP